MKFKFIGFLLFVALLLFSSCQMNKYYIDKDNGDDTNSGRSPKKAWATIGKVNSSVFQEGDEILFRGGQSFEGTILLDSINGEPSEKEVTISSFGQGKAVIMGMDSSALVASNCNYLNIHNLEFKGSGRKKGNTTSGIIIKCGSNIQIDSVTVSGFQKSGVEIIDAENVSITRVHAFENGMVGIRIGSVYHNPFKLISKNIYIGYCTTENNPGDPTVFYNHSGSGIIVSGTDSALVEYCLAKNNGWDQPWKGNGPIGIWAFHSNHIIIQHCISHSNKSNPKGLDGGGFDFDGGVTNSIMQYNLTYNNMGPGYGLYQYPGAKQWENNIVRYNISVNDGTEIDSCGLQLWNGQTKGPEMKNAHIYNNIFYNDFGRAVNYKSGNVPGLQYWNNIFVSKQEPIYGIHSQSVFNNNLYWRFGEQLENKNEDKNGIFANPMLVLPDPILLQLEDPAKLKELKFFKLLPGSPCLRKGMSIQENGGFDFWGNPLPLDSISLNIGVWQSEQF